MKRTLTEYLQEGILLQKSGKNNEAVHLYDQLIKKGVKDHNLFNLSALARKALGDFSTGLKHSIKANKLTNFSNVLLLDTYGTLLKDNEKYDEADKIFQKVLGLDNKNPNFLNNAATVKMCKEDYQNAVRLYLMALQINQKMLQPYENLTSISIKLKKFENTLSLLERAKNKNLKSKILLKNEIIVQTKLENIEDAISLNEQYKSTYSNDENYQINKMKILMADQRTEELRAYLKSINLSEISDTTLAIAAYANQSVNELDTARHYNKILLSEKFHKLKNTQKPIIRWNAACIDLKSGNERDAWANYSARFDWNDFPSEKRIFKVPRVNDMSNLKDKKVLLWREQGVGDEFLFLMLLKYFQEKSSAKIIIECGERLVPIFKQSFPDLIVRPATFDTSTMLSTHYDFDLHLPYGDLPVVTNFGKNDEEKVRPYVRYSADLKEEYVQRLKPNGKLICGLSWRSQKMTDARKVHYTSITDWIPLLRRDDIMVVNLQYGNIAEEIALIPDNLRQKLHILDIDLKNDFESQASLMAACDVIISPLNATFNQASAIGIPAITYMPGPGILTFGQLNELPKQHFSHPWYRTAKVFNSSDFSGNELVNRIIHELAIENKLDYS